jgi:hypothetical protein
MTVRFDVFPPGRRFCSTLSNMSNFDTSFFKLRLYKKDGKDRHGEDVDEGSAYQYNPEVFDEE